MSKIQKMDKKISNIKERILLISEIKGIAKEKFCTDIKMSYSSFKSDAKKRPLNSDAIAKILSLYPDVNAEWLLTGKGEMLKGEKESSMKFNGGVKVSNGGVGNMSGGCYTVHRDESKDQVIEKQNEQVDKSYDILRYELTIFHEKMEKKDIYIEKLITESSMQNRENLKRMEGLVQATDRKHEQNMKRVDEYINRLDALIKIITRQDEKIQERADKLVEILKKKL